MLRVGLILVLIDAVASAAPAPPLGVDQKLVNLRANQDAWARRAVLNVAASGQFSSDRSIAQYAKEIWDAKPCPVTWGNQP